MEQIKICPECGCEYYPHIESCADCGVILLREGEIKTVKEGKNRPQKTALISPVAVRQGTLSWMRELWGMLIDSGISCIVTADDDCNKGCCGNTYRLMVSSKEAAKADERIEAYYTEIHPEANISRELAGQGKCPACASPVESDTEACPDCGLTLLIIE